MSMITCVLFVVSLAQQFYAGSASPVGVWKTFDDHTGKASSLVRITEEGNYVMARIERLLTPGDEKRLCGKCPGDRKDQPLVGLLFMRRMILVNGEYQGGEILDPESGATYRCKLKVSDDGRTMRVRGFLGVSLFGRSQTWERQP